MPLATQIRSAPRGWTKPDSNQFQMQSRPRRVRGSRGGVHPVCGKSRPTEQPRSTKQMVVASTPPASVRDSNHVLKSQRGQGLVEYLIIVALMGIATIAIVRVMGQTVSSRFASITYALQGVKKSARAESVDESLYKKKDMSNFFDGVGSTKGERGETP